MIYCLIIIVWFKQQNFMYDLYIPIDHIYSNIYSNSKEKYWTKYRNQLENTINIVGKLIWKHLTYRYNTIGKYYRQINMKVSKI